MLIAPNLQVVHDVRFLVTYLSGDFTEYVVRVLESCSAEVLDLVKQGILQRKRSLEECLPAVIDTMIEAIVKKSVEVSWKCMGGVTTCFDVCNSQTHIFRFLFFCCLLF